MIVSCISITLSSKFERIKEALLFVLHQIVKTEQKGVIVVE